MKMTRRTILALWLVTICSVGIAWSETRYVSDQLVVSLRALPQNNSNVINYLRTDEKVDVIGEEGPFYKVKTKENEVGFIQKTYLVEATPKPIIIGQVSKENERLKSRINSLDQQYKEAIAKGDNTHLAIVEELQETRQQLNTLQKDLDESKSRLQKTSSSFDALKEKAKNVIEISADRDQLRASNEELSNKLAQIEEENFALQKSRSIRWFLAGAGVLLVGWIIGKSSGPRRRGSLY